MEGTRSRKERERVEPMLDEFFFSFFHFSKKQGRKRGGISLFSLLKPCSSFPPRPPRAPRPSRPPAPAGPLGRSVALSPAVARGLPTCSSSLPRSSSRGSCGWAPSRSSSTFPVSGEFEGAAVVLQGERESGKREMTHRTRERRKRMKNAIGFVVERRDDSDAFSPC